MREKFAGVGTRRRGVVLDTKIGTVHGELQI